MKYKKEATEDMLAEHIKRLYEKEILIKRINKLNQ